MKVYETTDIRNVGLVGHGHSGKTSLVAGLLFASGATNRLTRVDEGTTITDFDEEEIQRKITISTAIAAAEWNKNKINLIDTPGFNIFINDTRGTLVAADAAFVLVDGVAGVEVQTEKVWGFADEFQLPRAIVINKLDRERSSFDRALESVQEFFGRTAIPIHLPIGAESEFKGVVDLVRMKAYTYTNDGDGKGKEGEIPADMADAAQKAPRSAGRNGGGRQRRAAGGIFRKRHAAGGAHSRRPARRRPQPRISPVLCASGLHNIGSDQILNFIIENFPSPADAGTWKGTLNGKEVERAIKDSEPVSALRLQDRRRSVRRPRHVFQSHLRRAEKRRAIWSNARTGVAERLSHIGVLSGKTILPGHRTARGRYRRGRQAEGHAHRRHSGRQSLAHRLPGREAAGALHRLRHRRQDAQR